MNAISPTPTPNVAPAPIFEVSARHAKAVLPWDPIWDTFAPGAPKIDWKGQLSVVVPHNADITRVARNMGFMIPTPIEARYDWAGGTPYDTQRVTASLMTMFPRAYVLNGMGTGKTRSALWAFDFLKKEKLANSMLVVSPLSTLERTWMREIFTVTPHLRALVVFGDRKKRHERLRNAADIYIVNHHGLEIIQDEIANRPDIDVICFDELAVYRNGSAALSKVARKVSALKPRVWGMTGAPTPNGPTDAWSQARVVTPGSTPMSFKQFKDNVMIKKSNFLWVPKPDAKHSVYKLMQPAVRFALDEVTELPPVVVRPVQVPLGPKQEALYEQLRKHLFAMVAAQQVTVANAGVLLNKLLQVSLGWVYDTERGVIALDNDVRLQTLSDTIESNERKVICFIPFIHALKGVEDFLGKRGHSVAVVSGDTPAGERNRIFGAFQDTDKPHVLVAHPQCMAHGLTLTAADTIIWLGPYASLETFDQANARITRIGQSHKQQVLLFEGSKAESSLYAKLRSKQNIQKAILEMFQNQNPLV
jgi:SNF2 family DNA or RNA helicase